MHQNNITTIDDLISALNQCLSSEMGAILEKIHIPLADFAAFASWQEKDYTRNCIHRTQSYEMILLCWDKGAATAVHDHGGQECWVYQVDGHLQEKRFVCQNDKLNEVSHSDLQAGSFTYMQDKMGYHSLHNLADKRGMTLHIYASPIDSCKVYCNESKAFKQKDLAYDTQEEGQLVN